MHALKITRASFTDDPAICAIAKQSKYTRDFTSHRFFRANIEVDYYNGFVGVAKFGKVIAGFVYVKHLKRKPMSVIHYMGVETSFRKQRVGEQLLTWALGQSPHHLVELSCEDANEAAAKFYESVGLEAIGTGVYGAPPKERPYTRWRMT
jgi:ribosomal protein S18 acetylase RimI-like enzyme